MRYDILGMESKGEMLTVLLFPYDDTYLNARVELESFPIQHLCKGKMVSEFSSGT